ncbi:MAG TPA: hypothetical protein VGQ06_11180 [Gemmatimonadales bacterium]|jgi:hypothetical protein|nr:hypothetical protein [Gemmatimonadales bacterium]
MVAFVAILALPMLGGRWLAGPLSDQYYSGYAFREWQAEQWRATGHIPLWNPMILGGLPYLAAVTHGDVLYPTSFLRLVLPAHTVTNLGFVLHYILAGLLTYLLLRRLSLSWGAGVVGGLAYQLSGIMVSYAHPGHDGKLFVSTMLPLALLALVAAVRDRRWWGYALLSLAVALCLLSPHVQTTYFLLIAAGLFALYLTFGETTTEPLRPRLERLALALAAVVVGFGVAMPQILPFLEYIPHSPRAAGYAGSGTASYGVPWDHVPEFFIAGFTGEGMAEQGGTYWGSNPLKLHSEYLGLPVVALALLGAGDRRRRLVWWLGGIGLLFLLISLGGATPFYRVWLAVMPLVQKTRAPGMAFFIVAFVTAVFAALGAARLERGEGRRHVTAWLVAAGAVALLAVAGAFGNLAVSLAPSARAGAAAALGPTIRLYALIGAVALAITALVALGRLAGRIPAAAFACCLPLVLAADLWRDGRRFWVYSPPPSQGIYREDALVARLRSEPRPLRVLDLGVYPQNVLMAHDIPQVLGYQGNELRYYDDLLGGRGEWGYLLGSTQLWSLLAVRYVILPDSVHIPGYHRVMGPVATAAGTRGYLLEADTAPPYARVVPAAVKLDDERIAPTLADPRLPGFDRVVLLASDAPVTPAPVSGWPPPSPARAQVTSWRPGQMTIELDPAPASASYVLVSENWYVDWRAAVDGKPGQVLRGDDALITVPVAAGARRIELTYRSSTYNTGRLISLLSILILGAGTLVPRLRRMRSG